MIIPTQKIGKRPNGKSKQTHCSNGHEFNEENTYISPKSQKRCCRICQSTRNRRDFEKDIEGNRQKNRIHMQEWRTANRERDRKNWTDLRKSKYEWVTTQKVSCSICGETDPICLDFHHLDPAQKTIEISLAIARWSIKRIREEMDKCIVVCANCHRKLEAAKRGKES